ncbi:MAG TPA: helix-turn-helix domain-containing protein, partial [Acidimicrobiales bacterium]
MARRPQEPRTPDRAATEAALERAALELLERDGVLGGLNLREVADEAGVNRGLVYHYFGSRRDLLRAALGSDVRQRMRDLKQGVSLPARERYLRFLRTMIKPRHRRAVVLSALLVLDGDKGVRLDPDREGRHRRFVRDVEEGQLPADLDADAHWAATSSLVFGYALFRTRFAEELGIDIDEL